VYETIPNEGMRIGKEKLIDQLDITRRKANIVATLG